MLSYPSKRILEESCKSLQASDVERGGVLGPYYFNGKLYSGMGAYINGYNGYTSSENDGVLCALIPDKTGVLSCWDKDTGEPNYITSKDGCMIRDTAKRGLKCEFTEGVKRKDI
jgi:hypothetical protein